jgi:hypothetical protein
LQEDRHVTIPRITINGPSKTDLNSQAGTIDPLLRLWIAGVQIITPGKTLAEATGSLEFLQALEEVAGRLRHRMLQQVTALRHQQILERPETATEEEFQEAVAREFAPPPPAIVFYHRVDPTGPRTVWPWGSDLITHYDDAGAERGSLTVEPANIVIAAVRASVFGPILNLRGTNDLGDDPETSPV